MIHNSEGGMMKRIDRSLAALVPVFSLIFLCCLYSAAGAQEFTGLNDYQMWAANTGYPQGLLVPMGVDGVNQDYFHTLPGSAGYASGRIVIGDSRSCQQGIWQNRTGSDDYAVFAVWGGHYISGTRTPALTPEHLYEIGQCFQEQIRTHGKCTVFFFATVNDYDYYGNGNSAYIAAAVASAETIAFMSYEYEGTVYHPDVIVIGFDGGRRTGDIFGIPQDVFNRYIEIYNTELRNTVHNSPVLKENASMFTTVSEITGGKTGFISDGLHYSDSTLQTIAEYMVDFSAGGVPDAEVTVVGKEPEKTAGTATWGYQNEETPLIFYRIGN